MCMIFVFTSLFVWNLFLSKLPSLGTFLCLEVDVHSHVFLLASFSPGIPFLLNFKVLLRTTKLAQSTSKYYLVLRSLHPSTTSYYEACTQYSKYYFVLQSLREALPSTTSSKTCTNYFPVLLCPTKLAKKPFPVLNRITKLAPSTSLHRTTKRTGELLRGMDPKAGEAEALSVSLYLSTYLCIYLAIYLSDYLFFCLSEHLGFWLSSYLSNDLSVCLSMCPSISLSNWLTN